jgi:phospholipid/cholesterol/gamma-HCH transport system permease protein
MIDVLSKPFILVAQAFYVLTGTVFNIFTKVSGLYYLIGNIILHLPRFFRQYRFILQQMMSLGVASMPLVVVTSCFTGGVAASQAKYQFANLIPLTYLGTAICKSVVIELGPVLTALVMSGRMGASIAAELGTMKTNEQIDAMECLALDPVRYLIVPRVVAGMVMLLTLTIFADFIAILGAWFVSVFFLDVSSFLFLNGLRLFFDTFDVFAGLLKATVFGGIITLMGCYNGMEAEGGSEGVGKATMKSVVSSCVLILIFDFVVAALIF